MNREILFRGKRIDNGEWVRGLPFSFHANNNVEGIETYDGERHKVDPATVGQYTGLIDKNDKKVFEGDVMEFYVFGSHYKGVVSFVGGNFSVICNHPDASPFLDVVVKRYGAYVTNINDKHKLMEEKCVCKDRGLERVILYTYLLIGMVVSGLIISTAYSSARCVEKSFLSGGSDAAWNRRVREDG